MLPATFVRFGRDKVASQLLGFRYHGGVGPGEGKCGGRGWAAKEGKGRAGKLQRLSYASLIRRHQRLSLLHQRLSLLPVVALAVGPAVVQG